MRKPDYSDMHAAEDLKFVGWFLGVILAFFAIVIGLFLTIFG